MKHKNRILNDNYRSLATMTVYRKTDLGMLRSKSENRSLCMPVRTQEDRFTLRVIVNPVTTAMVAQNLQPSVLT